MKKKLRRIAAVCAATVIGAGALAMFAGCTTQYPEVTITYSFNGTDYAVEYKLSRYDAPNTVQHFIELADAGYYDGLCIHDYDSSYLFTGGYTIEDGELKEKDYFSEVKRLESEGKANFTQTVWVDGSKVWSGSPVYISADEERTPLYTVYGEFYNNGNHPENGREFVHSFGALAMYYKNKGKDTTRVVTVRNDSDGYDTDKTYNYNSATSLFYTYTGTNSNNDRDNRFAVFGKVVGTDDLQALLNAIKAYIDQQTTGEDEQYSFTEELAISQKEYNQYDPIEVVRKTDYDTKYHTPIDQPIMVKSVKVTKY